MEVPFDPNASRQDVAIVTGPSGAGRSTAIRALEDLGFEAIDNLPLALLERLLAGEAHTRPIALGVDARTRGFSAASLLSILEKVSRRPHIDVSLVFLDCETNTLLRRFSETRRRHPLSPHETPLLGIERERDLLAPLRGKADVLIDTTTLTPHELNAEVRRWFGAEGRGELAISVQSFSYKRGTPRGADMVLDCRFLRNPHWQPELRPMTGKDNAVLEYVSGDTLFEPFYAKTLELLELLLPAYKAEGKSYFTLGIGCTGGRHRSVCVAERLTNSLAQAGWQVSIRHRELELSAPDQVPASVVDS